MKTRLLKSCLMMAAVAALSNGLSVSSMAQEAVGAVEAAPFQSDRLSVEVIGHGPDVIFLHGYSSTREVWRNEATRLQDRYRVHLVQLGGFAGEPWSHGDGPVFQPALDEITRYARTLERPVLIGHSMGGLSGLMIAQQHPQLFAKVMSVDSLPFFGVLMDPNATSESLRPLVSQLATAIRNVPAPLYRAQQQQTAMGMTLNEERRADLVAAADASDRRAMATAFVELATADARAGLGAMTTPVWAVYAVDNSGGQGAMASAVWAREYAALPGVRLEPVENSRHFIMYDQPERLSALIDSFLQAD